MHSISHMKRKHLVDRPASQFLRFLVTEADSQHSLLHGVQCLQQEAEPQDSTNHCRKRHVGFHSRRIRRTCAGPPWPGSRSPPPWTSLRCLLRPRKRFDEYIQVATVLLQCIVWVLAGQEQGILLCSLDRHWCAKSVLFLKALKSNGLEKCLCFHCARVIVCGQIVKSKQASKACEKLTRFLFAKFRCCMLKLFLLLHESNQLGILVIGFNLQLKS